MDNDIKELILGFCSLVLKYQDDLLDSGENLNAEDQQYIEKNFNSFPDEKNDSDFAKQVNSIITLEHQEYCREWNSTLVSPYAFLSRFDDYERCFKDKWYEISSSDSFPEILEKAFLHIRACGNEFLVIKSYVGGFFSEFVEQQKKDLDNEIEEQKKDLMKHLTDVSEQKAKDLKELIDKREKNLNDKIDDEEQKLSEKVSENSVTILGIFSAIVLTVVAGLLYSSSVIESINSASIPKLMLVATLVGLICINIISVMFYYIDKFRIKKANLQILSEKNWLTSFIHNNTFIFLLNVVLIVILVISIILYVFSCYVPSPHENIPEQSNSNISVDVNISKGDAIPTDSNTMDSPIDTAPSDKGSPDETIDSTLSDAENTPTTDNIAP